MPPMTDALAVGSICTAMVKNKNGRYGFNSKGYSKIRASIRLVEVRLRISYLIVVDCVQCVLHWSLH